MCAYEWARLARTSIEFQSTFVIQTRTHTHRPVFEHTAHIHCCHELRLWHFRRLQFLRRYTYFALSPLSFAHNVRVPLYVIMCPFIRRRFCVVPHERGNTIFRRAMLTSAHTRLFKIHHQHQHDVWQTENLTRMSVECGKQKNSDYTRSLSVSLERQMNLHRSYAYGTM